jgi:uncharacterized membrane protein YkvA (DUF1232 family)
MLSDDNTALTIVVGFFAVILLIGVVLLGIVLYVIYRYRVPLRGTAAMLGALAYLVSPLDVVPDWFVPVGLVDDLGVVGAVGVFVYRLIQARRGAVTSSDKGLRPPDQSDRVEKPRR